MSSFCLYGLGGGLGHAVRVLALGRALQEEMPELRVEYILPGRLQKLELFRGLSVHCPPPESQDDAGQLARWLDTRWSLLKPDLLIVDVFPRGILAEFLECRRFPSKAVLLTRICRQGYYENPQMSAAWQRYQEIYWVESCPPPASIRGAREIGPITLFRRSLLKPTAEARAELGFGAHASTTGVLVLRAGPAEAQSQLVAAVRQLGAGSEEVDPGSGRLPTSVRIAWADHKQPKLCPIFPYFPGADLIVSAAGYHSLYELSQLQIPTIFWPQGRLYDDQHLRLRLLGVGSQPKHWIVQSGREFHKAFEEFEHLRSQVAFRRGGRDIEYSGAQRLAKVLLRTFAT